MWLGRFSVVDGIRRYLLLENLSCQAVSTAFTQFRQEQLLLKAGRLLTTELKFLIHLLHDYAWSISHEVGLTSHPTFSTGVWQLNPVDHQFYTSRYTEQGIIFLTNKTIE